MHLPVHLQWIQYCKACALLFFAFIYYMHCLSICTAYVTNASENASASTVILQLQEQKITHSNSIQDSVSMQPSPAAAMLCAASTSFLFQVRVQTSALDSMALDSMARGVFLILKHCEICGRCYFDRRCAIYSNNVQYDKDISRILNFASLSMLCSLESRRQQEYSSTHGVRTQRDKWSWQVLRHLLPGSSGFPTVSMITMIVTIINQSLFTIITNHKQPLFTIINAPQPLIITSHD